MSHLRLAAALLLGLSLSACSVPVHVDLLDAFPDSVADSFSLPLPSGEVDLLSSLTAPADSVSVPLSTPVPIQDLAFPEVVVPVPITTNQDVPRLVAATLEYRVTVAATEGLRGMLEVQPYLAPAGVSQIAQAAYALGPAQRIDLAPTPYPLQAEVSLSTDQLGALSDGSVKLALGVTGLSVDLDPSPKPELSYAFERLQLTVQRVKTQVLETFPDAGGLALDFRDQQVPGPGRLKTLGLAYRVVVEPGGGLDGTLLVQVYIAPPLAPGQTDADDPLFTETYRFGAEQALDLSRVSTLEDRASLTGAQEAVIESQRLRIGLQVRGEAELVLGASTTLRYRFQQLDLTGGYAPF